MDTKRSNSINLHLRNGSILKFRPTGKGLYQYTMKKNETVDGIWSLMTTANNNTFNIHVDNTKKNHNIKTVTCRADNYSKRQLKAAKMAQQLENIIMRPGARKFTDVCILHFLDCPITTRDAKAANNISGKNLGGLKGKTVRRQNPHVKTWVDPVPTKSLNFIATLPLPLILCLSTKCHFSLQPHAHYILVP